MENVSIWMSGYFQNVERLLDCPKPFRRHFLSHTRRMAEDFVQGNPEAITQELEEFLGEPQELARGFLETLDPEVLERYHRRKKLLHRGFVALLVAALISVSIFAVFFKKAPVNLEITEIIVLHDDLTYSG